MCAFGSGRKGGANLQGNVSGESGGHHQEKAMYLPPQKCSDAHHVFECTERAALAPYVEGGACFPGNLVREFRSGP